MTSSLAPSAPSPLAPAATPAVNLRDLEEQARAVLPQRAYDYFASGAWDEVTLAENRAAFDRIAVHYRVLVDVSRRSMATSLLGQAMAMPLVVAPTALHRLAHPDGELATVRAAGAAGVPMTLSSLATTAVEEVVAASAGPVWFQLYINPDRGFTRELVERVTAAGCTALVLTVDTPAWGRRERDVRNGFHLPEGLAAVNLLGADPAAVERGQRGAGMGQAFGWMLDASLSWRDVDWLAGITPLPLVLKGVCRPDDAVRAAEHGARAVVVSNHGGRQLDGAPAPIEVLPDVVDAVAGRLPVLVDGGVRRGVDVLRALALGAAAVQVGRPILWGLAAGGEAGVAQVLRLLRDELDLAMALAGCPDLASATRDLVSVRAGR
jgi:4-hydroxymandelate oxidase